MLARRILPCSGRCRADVPFIMVVCFERAVVLSMSILVTGASSQVGLHVRRRLAGAQSLTLVGRTRARAAAPGETWVQADMSGDPPPHALSEADAIVSFGPMDGLAAWLALQERVVAHHVVATSSMSAVSKRDSPVEADRVLSARLRAGEEALIAQCERLGIGWTILRPTMIYGAGLDHNLTPIARMARRTRVLPLPQASGLRQPVHAEDVAVAAIAAVRDGAATGRIVEIGGGERLSYLAMFQRLRESLGCRVVPVPVPGVALRAAAALLPPMRGPLGRLEADLVADNTVLNALLDVAPRPFHPDADTWRPRTWP